jgi:hypothetical protein
VELKLTGQIGDKVFGRNDKNGSHHMVSKFIKAKKLNSYYILDNTSLSGLYGLG